MRIPKLSLISRIDEGLTELFKVEEKSSISKKSIKVEEKLIFEMLSIVFNLKYLSQNFIKFKDQGQFWNPHDEQIPKLSLGVQFDQEIMEKTWETSCRKLTDCYCII